MEWVIALLAIGCLFFAFQIAMDYIKYNRTLRPKIQRLKQTKNELEGKIAETTTALNASRSQLPPIQKDVEALEREFHDLRQQTEQERQKPRSDRGQ